MAQINKPTDYFNTVLWTGNGSTQSITGVGFQPDWVWGKERNGTTHHQVYDSVRGATKRIYTSSTAAEGTISTGLTSFDSDGFSLGSNAALNNNTNTYVGWNWLADNTSGSSNTDGSITSTVSANTTSGFSIVSYTGTGAGATVGHGLGVAPSMIIVKNRTSGVEHWHVLHKSLNTTSGQYMLLSATNSVLTNSVVWNSTAPTSSVFSIGTAGGVNGSGNSLIAYCFAEKKGFSKFGSYTGNGNVDGTFVYLGFKPAMVILKRTDGGVANWQLNDSARDTFNIVNKRLAPSASDAEATNFNFGDFLSNGFKIRQTDQTWNTSGGNYIYMAFAESPLVGTNNIPATAR